MTKEIELTQGYKAIVDDEDYELVSAYKWRVHKSCRRKEVTYYAAAHGPRDNYKREEFKMHRLIMNAPKGSVVDHINRNGLDNRRCNLRICTAKENSRNQIGKRPYKYKGVNKAYNHFKAIIVIERKVNEMYLGSFKDEKSAAIAYDKAAIHYFGEFANLNFPDKIEEYKLQPYNPIAIRPSTRNIANGGYKGISSKRLKCGIKYYARFRQGDIDASSLDFDTVEEAAEAYDKLAIVNLGLGVRLNFPEKLEEYKRILNEQTNMP